MNNLMTTVALVGAMTIAAPAMAATTVNLSGTNVATAQSSLNLAAGTYSVSLIDGSTTAGAAAGALYTAVSVATPSGNNFLDYYQYSTDGGATFTFWNPFTPAAPRFATAGAAFAAYSAQPQLTLTLTNATNVIFQIGDSLNSLGDNTGGTSLSVAAVPEPATWGMMILGMLGIGLATRRSRRAQQAMQIA